MLNQDAEHVQDACSGFTAIMDIFDGINRMVFAPVAGPWSVHGFYLLIAMLTIGWFFFTLNSFFSVTYQQKTIEVDTLYRETVPYPDIYFCLPGQVVHEVVQPGSGFFMNSYGLTPRTLPGMEADPMLPPCNGLAAVYVLDHSWQAAACATNPMGISKQVNGTVDFLYSTNGGFPQGVLSMPMPHSEKASQLAYTLPQFRSDRLVLNATSGKTQSVPHYTSAICYAWSMRTGFSADRARPTYLVQSMLTGVTDGIISGGKDMAMQAPTPPSPPSLNRTHC